jgi:hypothetical protein
MRFPDNQYGYPTNWLELVDPDDLNQWLRQYRPGLAIDPDFISTLRVSGWRPHEVMVTPEPDERREVTPMVRVEVTISGERPARVHVSPAVQTPDWVRAAVCSDDNSAPSYDDLKVLHRAAFGDRWAYQVFAPAMEHVNFGETLHLWGHVDGQPALPDFAASGKI